MFGTDCDTITFHATEGPYQVSTYSGQNQLGPCEPPLKDVPVVKILPSGALTCHYAGHVLILPAGQIYTITPSPKEETDEQ
jgi:hypothetical protein